MSEKIKIRKVLKGVWLSEPTAKKLELACKVRGMALSIVTERALLAWFSSNPITQEEVAAFAATYDEHTN
ncbi:MAG: hypothetical protein U0350_10940 [Caldilineaceae bacterium]